MGALVTDRRLDNGGGGSTVALDASLRFLKHYRVQSQIVLSQTVEGLLSTGCGASTWNWRVISVSPSAWV